MTAAEPVSRTITLAHQPSLSATFARAVAGAHGRHGGPLPDLQVVQQDVRIDVGRLASYDQVCGFTLRDTVPSTYLLVLTFPLQVSLFADRSYPFALVGSVHVANTITQHRPVDWQEPLDLQVRATNARTHRRGVVVDVVGQVRVGPELVWEGVSSYLYRGAKLPEATASTASAAALPGAASGALADADAAADEPIDPTGSIWRLSSDLGRRYAAVSGDINPIHMHSLAAKAMGFPTAIAHGMWTKARMLADLENRLGSSYVAHVDFRKPVLLPSTVRFLARPDDGGGYRLALRAARGGDVHAFGSIHAG